MKTIIASVAALLLVASLFVYQQESTRRQARAFHEENLQREDSANAAAMEKRIKARRDRLWEALSKLPAGTWFDNTDFVMADAAKNSAVAETLFQLSREAESDQEHEYMFAFWEAVAARGKWFYLKDEGEFKQAFAREPDLRMLAFKGLEPPK